MKDTIKNTIDARFYSNKELLALLEMYINENPDLRFGQILFNFGFLPWHTTQDGVVIDDPFYEESTITLNRVKTIIEELCQV